jgi:alpha-D-xyloside xylohydrolase
LEILSVVDDLPVRGEERSVIYHSLGRGPQRHFTSRWKVPLILLGLSFCALPSGALAQQDSLAGRMTDDSRIFHRNGYSYEWSTTVKHAAMDGGVATFELQTQKSHSAYLRLFVVAPGMMRLQYGAQDAQFQLQSAMLLDGQGETALPAILRELENAYVFESADAGVSIRIEKSPFTLTLLDNQGLPSFETDRDDDVAGLPVTPALGFRSTGGVRQAFLSFRLRNDEHVFGLSEKYNKVEKTGTRATIWSTDTMGSNTLDLAYKAIPLLFSTQGWGLLVHSSAENFWEIGSFSTISGSVLVDEDHLDAFLFSGNSLKQLLYRYTQITGRPSMPPLWALGIWMSRASYGSSQQVEDIVAAARSRRFPLDVINIDPGWMATHYYFKIGVDACDFHWNTAKFSDAKEMFRELASRGMSVSMWINPYLPEGTPIYEEAKAKGFMASDGHGGVARLEGGEPVGAVDFTNPAATEWWKEHLRELLRMGAAVFKTDYGEGIARHAVFYNGQNGATMHNLYTMLYSKAAFETVREVHGQGMVWRRSGYIGAQRYPGTWAGDTQPTWAGLKSVLRGGLSAGISGEAFWSHDIGGFAGPKPSPELYIRWAEFGLLSPLSRFHGNTPREPWEFGPEAERIVTKYARLRYRLMPYLVESAEESVRTGVPMLRHMALEFPAEPNAYTLDDQYALGSNLLVAPIIVEGARARQVYFPRGRWKALEHPTTVFTGPGFHEVAASLDYIPVFVREGGKVPMLNEDVQNLKNPDIVKHSGPWQLAMHHSATPKDSRRSAGNTSGQPASNSARLK